MMLIFLSKIDTYKYFGQVESQFVRDIQNIVFLFIVPNLLLYPLLYKLFSEIYYNLCRAEGKLGGLEL